MIEFYAYPIIALLFVGVFCREVIAPASQNRCDHRWLLLSAGLGVSTVVVTLGIGLVFAKVIERNALIHASLYMPAVLVGADGPRCAELLQSRGGAHRLLAWGDAAAHVLAQAGFAIGTHEPRHGRPVPCRPTPQAPFA